MLSIFCVSHRILASIPPGSCDDKRTQASDDILKLVRKYSKVSKGLVWFSVETPCKHDRMLMLVVSGDNEQF